MKQPKFFIANDQQLSLQKAMTEKRISSIHASMTGLIATDIAQLNYCFSNNMVMVTSNKIILELSKVLKLPVIEVKKGSSNDNIIK